DNAGLDHVDVSFLGSIVTDIALAAQHLGDNHAAIDRRVLRNLPRRHLDGTAKDQDSSALVALALIRLVIECRRAADEGETATWDDPLGNRRLGGADGVVERILARFHLGLRRRADTDDSNAAGKLGKALLQ